MAIQVSQENKVETSHQTTKTESIREKSAKKTDQIAQSTPAALKFQKLPKSTSTYKLEFERKNKQKIVFNFPPRYKFRQPTEFEKVTHPGPILELMVRTEEEWKELVAPYKAMLIKLDEEGSDVADIKTMRFVGSKGQFAFECTHGFAHHIKDNSFETLKGYSTTIPIRAGDKNESIIIKCIKRLEHKGMHITDYPLYQGDHYRTTYLQGANLRDLTLNVGQKQFKRTGSDLLSVEERKINQDARRLDRAKAGVRSYLGIDASPNEDLMPVAMISTPCMTSRFSEDRSTTLETVDAEVKHPKFEDLLSGPILEGKEPPDPIRTKTLCGETLLEHDTSCLKVLYDDIAHDRKQEDVTLALHRDIRDSLKELAGDNRAYHKKEAPLVVTCATPSITPQGPTVVSTCFSPQFPKVHLERFNLKEKRLDGEEDTKFTKKKENGEVVKEQIEQPDLVDTERASLKIVHMILDHMNLYNSMSETKKEHRIDGKTIPARDLKIVDRVWDKKETFPYAAPIQKEVMFSLFIRILAFRLAYPKQDASLTFRGASDVEKGWVKKVTSFVDKALKANTQGKLHEPGEEDGIHQGFGLIHAATQRFITLLLEPTLSNKLLLNQPPAYPDVPVPEKRHPTHNRHLADLPSPPLRRTRI